jgi:hypothetical protein
MHSRKRNFPAKSSLLCPQGKVAPLFILLLIGALAGCRHTAPKNPDPPRPQPTTQDATTRLSGTFICDRIPSDVLNLRPDGTFIVREDGNLITGSYIFNGTTLVLVPDDGSPSQTGIFDGSGFVDPNGSHWSLKGR